MPGEQSVYFQALISQYRTFSDTSGGGANQEASGKHSYLESGKLKTRRTNPMAFDRSDERQHAHAFLDRLPDDQLSAVCGLLEKMLSPLDRKLALAPIDDEPVTPDVYGHVCRYLGRIYRAEHDFVDLDPPGGVCGGRVVERAGGRVEVGGGIVPEAGGGHACDGGSERRWSTPRRSAVRCRARPAGRRRG